MSSFVDVINDLVSCLQTDTDLQNFCKSRWNKTLIVSKVFKHRTEINLSDLPIILLTWPGVEEGSTEDDNTIRLYSGFHQPVRELALEETIQFQEYIRLAVLKDKERNKLALYTRKRSVVTDEGYYHPVYFSVRDIGIEIPVDETDV